MNNVETSVPKEITAALAAIHGAEALDIVKGILRQDDPMRIKQHLQEMMDAYFLRGEIAQPDREEAYYNFRAIAEALDQISDLKTMMDTEVHRVLVT